MRVTVRLFARLRDLAGRADWDVEVAPAASIADVWRTLAAQHPALAPFGDSVSCALNEDFARMGTKVREGDEVAFLPPVSGGQSLPAERQLCPPRRSLAERQPCPPGRSPVA